MPWAPGQSGNLAGYHGSRRWRHREVFEDIKRLGHRDALVTLPTIQRESQDDSLRVAAAAALAPYAHPKLQSLPTPRSVENPIEVPEFTHLSDAESFLAKIAALVARGELDIQTGLELSTLAKNWIEAQYAREELAIKQINAGATDQEQTIRIEGGLPQLPGTNTIMPVLDHSPATNGHALAPEPVAMAVKIESTHQDPTPEHAYGDPHIGPRTFLLRVMHDPDVAIRDRIKAASTLLRLAPGTLPHSRIASAGFLTAPYQRRPIQGPRWKEQRLASFSPKSLMKAPAA